MVLPYVRSTRWPSLPLPTANPNPLDTIYCALFLDLLRRARHNLSAKNAASVEGGSTPAALPAHLADFKAFDALATGGAASCDSRPTPCPLCGRSFGGQRGLRMHLVGAHPLEIRDRDHFVLLLKQGSASLPSPPANGDIVPMVDVDEAGDEGGGVPAPRTGAGAAAKGRAVAALPPGFAAARAGDVERVRRLVGGSDNWDPKTAMDKNGSSPLDWAAGEGRLEVCRWGGREDALVWRKDVTSSLLVNELVRLFLLQPCITYPCCFGVWSVLEAAVRLVLARDGGTGLLGAGYCHFWTKKIVDYGSLEQLLISMGETLLSLLPPALPPDYLPPLMALAGKRAVSDTC